MIWIRCVYFYLPVVEPAIKPQRTITPMVTVSKEEIERRSIQKSIRQWFLWRYPKIKEFIDLIEKTMPDVIIEELLHKRYNNQGELSETKDEVPAIYELTL